MREWGVDKAWQPGVILAGASAGALCWFEAWLSDSYPKVLSAVRGFGFLPGSCDVHDRSRPDRAARFRDLIASGALPGPGLALDGGTLPRDRLIELISADRNAGA